MAQPAEQLANPGHFYAQSVLNGTIPANKLIQCACQRYLDDWQYAEERGFLFDEEAAYHAIDYIQDLKLTKGKWAGKPFVLSHWQAFIVWNLFGWFMKYEPDESEISFDPPDYVRRFRYLLLLIPRKNGKTAFMAALLLYLTDGDGEALAEVYSGATTRDQAKLVWNDCVAMRASSPSLRARSRKNISKIEFDHGGLLKPLASNYDKLDGLNSSGSGLDELHQHPDRGLFDVIDQSTGAREQPLMIMISTAGNSTASFCYEMRCKGERIALGQEKDDTMLAMIHEPDQGDDWTDERVWRKVNPNLGISIHMHDMRVKFDNAQSTASGRVQFKQVRLGFWPGGVDAFLDLEEWRACADKRLDIADFAGKECVAAIDLASTRDFNSLSMTFGVEKKRYTFVYFWVAKKTAQTRQKDDRIPYLAWEEEGLIRTTPGYTTDYSHIVKCIDEELLTDLKLQIKCVYLDPWNSRQIESDLEDLGLVVVHHRQGYASMNEPTKELERAVCSGNLVHSGHHVLDWMVGNMMVQRDPAGNVKPDKKRSREKIDGVVTTIMTMTGFLDDAESDQSAYVEEFRNRSAQQTEQQGVTLL